MDHAFLRYEKRRPRANLEIGGIAYFAGVAPTLTELRQDALIRLASVPELGWKLDRSARPWRAPSWVQSGELDLRHHIRERILPADGTHRAALSGAVDEIMGSPLPRDQPWWQLWLLHGYSGDEWCALFKTHHALVDGGAILRMIRRLLGADATDPGSPAGPVATPAGTRRRTRARDLFTVVKGALRYARAFLPLAGRPFTGAGYTGQRGFAWAGTELSRLRAVADRHGVTVNEIFLAALAGALRDWPYTPWRRGRPAPVWAMVPVDTRQLDGAGTGNRAVPLRLPLPCDEDDPARRLMAVRRHSVAVKSGERATVGRAAISTMPRWLVGLVFAVSMSRWHVNLLASAMWASNQPLDYRGQPALRMVPLGFLPRGHPVSAFLLTYHDRVCVTFLTSSSLPAGDELAGLWVRAVDELAEIPPRFSRRTDG